MAKSKSTKEPEYPITKYFQLANPDIHIYTRAALEVQFRGIMKTESEWSEALEEYQGK